MPCAALRASAASRKAKTPRKRAHRVSPRRAVLGLSLLLLLAGCISAPDRTPFLGGEGPPTIAGGWLHDCTIASAANWTDPCTAKGTVTHGPANELMLAVNPTDPDNVVIGAKDYTPEGSDCVWAGTSITHDGGRTWTNGWVGGSAAERDPRFRAYQCVTDPVLEFGADGVLYYLVEAYNAAGQATGQLPDPTGLGAFGAGSQMWLAVSQDGGETWDYRGVITAGPGGAVLLHDKSDMAVSPVSGTIVASWTAFNMASSQLLYVRSADGGNTFTPPRPLMRFDDPARAQDATAMVDLDWDAQGDLHAIWFNWNTGDVTYAVSRDDGSTFTAPVVIAPAAPWTGANAPNSEFRIFDSTMMAVDLTEGPRAGWLYATWADDLLAPEDHDVWFLHSEDSGASWSLPVQVGSQTGSDQFHPNLVVAGDGSLHIFFYDRSYDGANNTLLDVTHGLSLDGGTTWAWTRVSNTSFDGDLGIHQSGVPFMGDYNGIGTAGDVVYLTYADTRMGQSDVAVAKFRRT